MKNPEVRAFRQKEFWENVGDRNSPYLASVAEFARPKVDLIAEKVGLEASSRVLEVGCGNGFFTVHLASRWKVTALDQSARMLSLNPHDRLVRGAVEALSFPDGSFDLVFSANLLHHLPDPGMVVREMARVSRRYVALVEPNRNNPAMYLFSLLKEEERGARKFTETYVRELLLSSGLRPLYACTHGSLTPNRTPGFLISVLKPFNKVIPLGFYILALGEKA